MLPHISGFDICKKARGEKIETPIILLTAKGEEIDKVDETVMSVKDDAIKADENIIEAEKDTKRSCARAALFCLRLHWHPASR